MTEDDRASSGTANDPSTPSPGGLSPTAAFRLAIEAGAAPGRVGPYRLVRRIGEGGMGEVWEAEQREPIQRRVAVKLVKLGMDTRQFVARFESERQALALMEHPAIARVIDGGTTDAGRPYFVMEYVEGVPITEFCDRERLSIRERIELFLLVCEGVQHAHQKGVIHRDLKPSNVLVTVIDGQSPTADRPYNGQPKIIDFGVAKVTAPSLAERTAHTVLGGWIGTPAYMSPEQAQITDDIDTRTDVYSLGVMLYELLTGLGPFDTDTLHEGGVDEMRRLIRDVEPPRPSTRARSSGATGAGAAERRGVEPRALVKHLTGDLDWIVMKAIEKEKERRYGSPAELAADLRRHLHSEPVLAGPPSPLYRAGKFVRRHRVIVVASGAVVLALLAAVTGTTMGLLRARSEARRASEEAAAAEATASFLAGLFQSEDPGEAEGADLSARDILERGRARLTTELTLEPATRAKLLQTIGVVYRNLGLLEESEASLRQSLEARRKLGGRGSEAPPAGAGDRDLASALVELAITVKDRGSFDEAAALLDEATGIMNRALPPGDPLRLSILTTTGLLYRDRADRARAEPPLVQAVVEARAAPNLPPGELATNLNNLALHYWSARKLDQAEPLFVEAIATAERAPHPNQVDLAVMYNNLGLVYVEEHRYRDAEPMYDKSLAISERMLGPDHPRVAVVLHNYGDLLREEGDLERAAAAYARSRKILEERLGSTHPNVSTSLIGSAQVLAATGRLEDARTELERAIAIREAAFGVANPRLKEPLTLYAGVLRQLGRDGDAAATESRLAALAAP
jgi:non-specific serine/threonine protein kinase/serine/threonine-protein kinase